MAYKSKLVAWWSMDEESGERADSHGGFDLADNNTVLYAAGKQSNAADFVRANNEYLSHVDHADFSADGHEPLMITGWVNLDILSSNMAIISKYGTANEWMLWFYNTTPDRFRFSFRKNDDSGDLGVNSDDFGAPSTGTWYFVVAWHDPDADVIAIQVNDGTPTTLAFAFGGIDTTDPLLVGDCGLADFNLEGILDEVAIWDTILTTAEKTWLYNSGDGRAYSELDAFIPTSTTIF